MPEHRKATRLMFIPETGEAAGIIYEGDRIVRAESKEYLDNSVELLPDEPYAKVFTRAVFALSETLTGQEMLLVLELLPYLSYDSGMLKHSNGKPLTRKNIAEMADKELKTIDRVIQSLKEKQVLGRNVVGREVQYFLNPWLFMRGKRVNRTLYDMFVRSRWAKLVEMKKKSPAPVSSEKSE